MGRTLTEYTFWVEKTCCVLVLIATQIFSQSPPGVPEITGPDLIILGNTITLTCTVNGGNPTPKVTWLRDNNVLDETSTTFGSRTINNITFVASATEHLAVFECQSENGVLQNPLSRTKFIQVNRPPSDPVLSGPTNIISGNTKTWVCVSSGAYPIPNMTMRIENRDLSSSLVVKPTYDVSTKTYNITGTLTWAPTTSNNGQILYCDVGHLTLPNPKTVSLPLTVSSPLDIHAPTTLYEPKTGDTITLNCIVRAGTATFVRWFKNGNLINISSNQRLSGGTVNTIPLTISQVVMSDAGIYVCQATDGSVTLNTTDITVITKAAPQTPTLSGPSSVLSGTSNTWTCVSRGGSPQPEMSMRIGNNRFVSEVSTNAQFDQSTNSYVVIGTLVWAPSSRDNLQTLYCDVTHPETLGNTPQTVSLPLTVITSPKTPTLSGPTSVKQGSPSTWTCTSIGAYPEQTMSMRIGNQPITSGFTTDSQYDDFSKLYRVIGTLAWSPSSTTDANTLFCDVRHPDTLGQTPQTASLQLTVQNTPQKPVLSGPTTVITGTTNTWTCVSRGGFPEATMSMRIGNIEFTSEVTVNSVFDQTTQSYTVTGSLVWAAVSRNNGDVLFCDVYHTETLGNVPQTVSLPLTVHTPPRVPVLSGPTETISGTVNTWTCTSTGAYPEQTMSFRLGSTAVTSGITYNAVFDGISKLYKVTGTLTWNPKTINNGDTLFCDVTHVETLGQNPQTASLQITVHTTPQLPELTGPTRMTAGLPQIWTCTSEGGFPQQTMSMRIGTTVFTNEFTTNAVYNSNTKLYTVTGTLTWSPSVSHDGQVLTCDVFHPETLGTTKQSTSLRELTVHAPIVATAPTTTYSPTVEDTVTLDCVVTSGSPTSIKWYKDNTLMTISASNRLSGAFPNGPSLTITDVALTDGGNYVCEATDGLSTDQTSTIFLSPIEKPWTEFVIINYILDGYDRLVRPIDPVVNMTHSLVPRAIMNFDGKELELQTMQCMRWNDPRLTWPKGQPRVSLPASSIWIPDVVLLGEKYEPDFETKVIVTKEGNVIYCPQGPIMASDCQEKAGEIHECYFKFLSWSYNVAMLDIHFPSLRTADALVDLSMFVEHDKYEIVNRCGVRNEETYSCREGTYAELTYTISVSRRRTFCRNYSDLPTCLTAG